MPNEDEQEETERDLADQICERVRDWVKRAAPMVDNFSDAQLTIRLDDPGRGTTGELSLRARFTEELEQDSLEGRVTGVKARNAE